MHLKRKNAMKFKLAIIALTAALMFAPTAYAGLTLDELMDKVETRHAGTGFSARFLQQSTIKAMDITDNANGKIQVKRPGMMRWEYEKPTKQVIVSDGQELWVHKPQDNQVMIGKAADYFGDGKGASFLSDIRLIRKNFTLSLEKEKEGYHVIKLLPKEKKFDISAIYLSVSKKTFEIEKVITYNSYEDETIIQMTNYQFNQDIDNSVFRFTIPQGAEVLQMEE